MRRIQSLLAACLVCLVLNGCGTLFTRAAGPPFGEPAYAASSVDLCVLNGLNSGADVLALPILLVSLPVDLVLDTGLLPLDLLCEHAWDIEKGVLAIPVPN